MTRSDRRIAADTLGMGGAGRMATALVAAAVFVLLLVFGALVVAVAVAGAVVSKPTAKNTTWRDGSAAASSTASSGE